MLSFNCVKGGRSQGGNILRRSFLAAQEKSFIHLKGGEGKSDDEEACAAEETICTERSSHLFFIEVVLI